MLKANFNKLMRIFLHARISRIEDIRQNSIVLQEDIMKKLIARGTATSYGKSYGFEEIRSYKEYSKQLPIVTYENISHHIKSMMEGKSDVLWPGKVTWFAKSSGTTSEKSKYLPITDEFHINNLVTSSWDTSTIMYDLIPNCKSFGGKNLTMCGSLNSMEEFPNITVGDVSAIMLQRMPSIGKPFMCPQKDIALLPNWEDKIALMSKELAHEDVVMFGGVPTWTIVLFERMLKDSGAKNMLELWPNVACFLHGGVGFEPYKKIFQKYLPKEDFYYIEAYNASEGYFAIQDNVTGEGMLLLTNNDIFYEFVPLENLEKTDIEAVELKDVIVGKNYAMVISTSAGLWRYMPGDTVKFTSKDPYRIKVTGRTKHFINVFGEEVIISNTDQALKMACEDFGCIVSEYNVGPRWLSGSQKGGHEWMIEFERSPINLNLFSLKLDHYLQSVNSDYEAKRFNNLALDCLKIQSLPKGTFVKWLQSKGKSGGQHKVPRLSNSRQYLEEIKEFVGQ